MRTPNDLTHAEFEWLFAAANEVYCRCLFGSRRSEAGETGATVMAIIHAALKEARAKAEAESREREDGRTVDAVDAVISRRQTREEE